MAESSGFVLMYRSLLGHAAFRDDGEALVFMWMVAKAAWKPARVRYKGRPVDLQRGQLCVSCRDMGEAVGRSKTWVTRFLNRLESEAMIGTSDGTAKSAAATVITICNYDKFQAPSPPAAQATGTAIGTGIGTAAGQQRDTEQQDNKLKNDVVAGAREIVPGQVEWDPIGLADHVARIAGVRHLEPGRIASNVSTVREWLRAGADPPLIAATVQAVRDKLPDGSYSLSRFDAAVRRRIAQKEHPGEPSRNDPTQIRDPLLRRYIQNGGSLAS